MSKVKIDKKRCKGCGLCAMFCPSGVLFMDEELNENGIFCASASEDRKCTGCGFCFLMCPDACIEIEDIG